MEEEEEEDSVDDHLAVVEEFQLAEDQSVEVQVVLVVDLEEEHRSVEDQSVEVQVDLVDLDEEVAGMQIYK